MLSSAIGSSVAGQASSATTVDGSGHWTAGKGAVDGVAHPVANTMCGIISHMKQRYIDISGQRFNRLVAIEPAGRKGSGRKSVLLWRCVCDCGNESVVPGSRLRAGEIKSCGCAWRDSVITHGMTKTKEYRTWNGMIDRCHNTANKRYPYYGGRGIAVCEKWRASFESFYADMGDSPSPKHSIDRIDVNAGYSPENCRWTDHKTQCRNRRSNVYHSAHGLTMLMPEWAEYLGISEVTIRLRLRRGVPPEKAFSDKNVRYGSIVQSKRKRAGQ